MMSDLLMNRFLEILNMGVASGATHTHEDHAPEGPSNEGQEKGQGRQVLTDKAAVRLVWDSRRLPRDRDGEGWA